MRRHELQVHRQRSHRYCSFGREVSGPGKAPWASLIALLIGRVIVGFGASAPEMVVSAMAVLDGNPDLVLGNALGSNIVNTGLILGVTAWVALIAVHSKIVRKESKAMDHASATIRLRCTPKSIFPSAVRILASTRSPIRRYCLR